jgi:hypothetical protein
MIGRALLSLVSAGAACATWNGLPPSSPHPVAVAEAAPIRTTDSIFSELLPRHNSMIPVLDRAYAALELEMRPHGCSRCHAPDDPSQDRGARVRHAHHLLAARRAIVPMLRANLMPPATDEHPAGIADDAARERLILRAEAFRVLGDQALE